MGKHGERSKMSWEWSLKFKTTQNREGKMKKLIKTSFSFFAVFALMITFSLQQVIAAELEILLHQMMMMILLVKNWLKVFIK